MKVGDKLFVVYHRQRCEVETYYAEVCKVGRKYFELVDHPREKFKIEGMTEKSEYYKNYSIYSEEQIYLDMLENSDLWDKAKKVFDCYSSPISLEKLREINKILEDLT